MHGRELSAFTRLDRAVKDAIEAFQRVEDLLTDKRMHSGALSFLPAGGPECEEKVRTALDVLQTLKAQ